MNETTVNTQPQGGDFNKHAFLETFDGLKAVAKPDGECANDTLLKPSFPEHGTQSARLLAALLSNEQLTHKTAWATLGISRLAAVAHKLKTDFNWHVKNPGLRVVNRFGEMSDIGLYMLEAADVAQAGICGTRYVDIEYAQMASLAAKTKLKQAAC